MSADFAKTLYCTVLALCLTLLLTLAATLTGSAIAQTNLGTLANPQTEDLVIVVGRNGHRWIACGTEAQMDVQDEAHRAHGHHHDFRGPCGVIGLIVEELPPMRGIENSNGAAGSEGNPPDSGTGDPGINTDDCVSASTGTVANTCETEPSPLGPQIRRQIRQQARNRLPVIVPGLRPVKDEDDGH